MEAQRMTKSRRRSINLLSPVIDWSLVPKHDFRRPVRNGDWSCDICKAVNFAFRNQCYHCHNKPNVLHRHMLNELGGDDTDIRPEDWRCNECRSVVFAAKTHCFNCKSPRQHSPSIMKRIDHGCWLPGDWSCSGCGFANFASRKVCLQCHTAK